MSCRDRAAHTRGILPGHQLRAQQNHERSELWWSRLTGLHQQPVHLCCPEARSCSAPPGGLASASFWLRALTVMHKELSLYPACRLPKSTNHLQ